MRGFDKLSPQGCALSLSQGLMRGFDKPSPQGCALSLSKGHIWGFDKPSPQVASDTVHAGCGPPQQCGPWLPRRALSHAS
jgi:hypothetical protein